MLEKIGLPAKPSMRGANWVVDASHCQGCSSQFSFFNRKHHCRRCGGIFCNSCTLQRMTLRGQGDAPVRICDPCKKLEDAARFELRYGHRNRQAKGNLKLDPKAEEKSSNQNSQTESSPEKGEDALSGGNMLEEVGPTSPEELRTKAVEEKNKYKVLKGEGKNEEALRAFKRSKELERQAQALEIASRKTAKKAKTTSSSKNTSIGRTAEDGLLSELRNLGWDDKDLHDHQDKKGNLSLEGELSGIVREVLPQDNSQVLAHKKKALALKREGKLAEAKEELKKAKILERELEEQALLGLPVDDESDDELAAIIRGMDDQKNDDVLADYDHSLPMNLDFLSLPDNLDFDENLNVNEDDMNDPDMAAALKSFGWNEEDDKDDDDEASPPVNKESLQDEVLRLKREALKQKRAGNKTEAMELLRKAKQYEQTATSASLSSSHTVSKPKSKLSLQRELLAVKKKARALRSEGKLDEAEEELKKGKELEIQLEEMDSKKGNEESDDVECIPEVTQKDMERETVFKPKSKLSLQRELLAVKKKARALRSEGRFDEAEEELKKGKDLEIQLEEMDSTKAKTTGKVSQNSFLTEESDDVECIPEVTEKDMDDPVLLSALKNLGWAEEEDETRPVNKKISKSKGEIQRELLAIKRKALALRREGKTKEASEELEKAKPLEEQIQAMDEEILERESSPPLKTKSTVASAAPEAPSYKRGDMGSASSSLSRKSPAIREDILERETSPPLKTNSTEASAALDEPSGQRHGPSSASSSLSRNRAAIEKEIPERETSPPQKDKSAVTSAPLGAPSSQRYDQGSSSSSLSAKRSAVNEEILERETNPPLNSASSHSGKSPVILEEIPERETSPPLKNKAPYSERIDPGSTSSRSRTSEEISPPSKSASLQDQILALKRKALALKREGKLAEAREELKQAKLLEKTQEESRVSTSTSTSAPSTVRHVSARDRFKLQQEVLSHKRLSLKLKREGKIEESEVEFNLAKSLEAQLEEISTVEVNEMDGGDLLDPQLISALRSLGWDESEINGQKAATSPIVEVKTVDQDERAQIMSQISAEKRRAVGLKRAGKQAQALEALRAAKALEKKLASLG